MLTVKQAADRLGIRPATIRAWIYRRENLDFVKVGRAIRIPEDAVERFIRENLRRPMASDRRGAREKEKEADR